MRLSALIVVFCGMQFAQVQAAAPDAEPVQHEFVIRNFKTESGTVLPEARIVYGTYGKLNAKGDNAVLLPSHYMAEMHGYGWLIGPGKALDPSKLYLVASELFGNGRSSSPSNTPEPFHGPRFPVTTIRDNVEAVHSMLTAQLHVQLFGQHSMHRFHIVADRGDGESRSMKWFGRVARRGRSPVAE